MRLIRLAAVAAVLTAPAAAHAQAEADFTVLREWDAEFGVSKTLPSPDTLRLESGTIRTRGLHDDFVFRFEYRIPDRAGGAVLWVRSRYYAASRVTGYGIALDAGPDRGRLRAESHVLHEGPAAPPAEPIRDGRWVAGEVRAERDQLTVTLDGVVTARADGLDALSGHIGFKTRKTGGIELRGLRLATLSQQDTFPTGLPSADAKGIKPPKVAHSERPVYPRSAFDDRVSGIVELEIAIDADGRLTHARVKKTPHRDLGVAAIDCARRWRFKPATKDGVPIAVVATMDVAFKFDR